MGARLFTAILPPAWVMDELGGWLEPRREAGAEVWRWTRPEGWHLTTAFMASVPASAQQLLVEGLGESVARAAPFEVRISGALCFPHAAKARALAMAVTEGKESLAALARTCRGVATRAGASPDGANFVGHLTLACARKPLDATKWVHVVDAFPGWTWRVQQLVLVESHLADRGNRYEVLERFTLAGEGALAGGALDL